MRLNQILIFILFTFVSCDSIENPLGDNNVYEFKYEYTFFGGLENKSFNKMTFHIQAECEVKFTISDEDECVYYIYKFDNIKFPVIIEDATRELLKVMNPAIFEIKFFDKEDNEIWKWNSRRTENYKSAFLIGKEDDFPFIRKGKMYDIGINRITPEVFRSKLKRTERTEFKIMYYNERGSDEYK